MGGGIGWTLGEGKWRGEGNERWVGSGAETKKNMGKKGWEDLTLWAFTYVRHCVQHSVSWQ
jgi:hypothetical protein